MKKTVLFITLIFTMTFTMQLTVSAEKKEPDVNVIHGDNHIFTVETPEGWINDKKTATTIGLVSLFYPIEKQGKKIMTYFYAMGYDKETPEETLKDFIKGNLKNYKKKNSNVTYKKNKTGYSGGIINGAMYTFDNLNDRYKEEVIYMETKYSFFVFPFSALNKQDYDKYQPIFDKFIASFKYRGHDPKPFLNWLKKKQ